MITPSRRINMPCSYMASGLYVRAWTMMQMSPPLLKLGPCRGVGNLSNGKAHLDSGRRMGSIVGI